MSSLNGVAAVTTVSSDSAKEISFRSMYKIVSKYFKEVHLFRINVVTLGTGTKSIRIKNGVI